MAGDRVRGDAMAASLAALRGAEDGSGDAATMARAASLPWFLPPAVPTIAPLAAAPQSVASGSPLRRTRSAGALHVSIPRTPGRLGSPPGAAAGAPSSTTSPRAFRGSPSRVPELSSTTSLARRLRAADPWAAREALLRAEAEAKAQALEATVPVTFWRTISRDAVLGIMSSALEADRQVAAVLMQLENMRRDDATGVIQSARDGGGGRGEEGGPVVDATGAARTTRSFLTARTAGSAGTGSGSASGSASGAGDGGEDAVYAGYVTARRSSIRTAVGDALRALRAKQRAPPPLMIVKAVRAIQRKWRVRKQLKLPWKDAMQRADLAVVHMLIRGEPQPRIEEEGSDDDDAAVGTATPVRDGSGRGGGKLRGVSAGSARDGMTSRSGASSAAAEGTVSMRPSSTAGARRTSYVSKGVVMGMSVAEAAGALLTERSSRRGSVPVELMPRLPGAGTGGRGGGGGSVVSSVEGAPRGTSAGWQRPGGHTRHHAFGRGVAEAHALPPGPVAARLAAALTTQASRGLDGFEGLRTQFENPGEAGGGAGGGGATRGSTTRLTSPAGGVRRAAPLPHAASQTTLLSATGGSTWHGSPAARGRSVSPGGASSDGGYSSSSTGGGGHPHRRTPGPALRRAATSPVMGHVVVRAPSLHDTSRTVGATGAAAAGVLPALAAPAAPAAAARLQPRAATGGSTSTGTSGSVVWRRGMSARSMGGGGKPRLVSAATQRSIHSLSDIPVDDSTPHWTAGAMAARLDTIITPPSVPPTSPPQPHSPPASHHTPPAVPMTPMSLRGGSGGDLMVHGIRPIAAAAAPSPGAATSAPGASTTAHVVEAPRLMRLPVMAAAKRNSSFFAQPSPSAGSGPLQPAAVVDMEPALRTLAATAAAVAGDAGGGGGGGGGGSGGLVRTGNSSPMRPTASPSGSGLSSPSSHYFSALHGVVSPTAAGVYDAAHARVSTPQAASLRLLASRNPSLFAAAAPRGSMLEYALGAVAAADAAKPQQVRVGGARPPVASSSSFGSMGAASIDYMLRGGTPDAHGR